jgi:archaellum biogenesis ATPase FlaH
VTPKRKAVIWRITISTRQPNEAVFGALQSVCTTYAFLALSDAGDVLARIIRERHYERQRAVQIGI